MPNTARAAPEEVGQWPWARMPIADTTMAKTLFAVDELTGLITATALVKPTRSVHDVDAAGIRKRMKDKAFARGVSREDVVDGARELGVDLDQHIAFVIAAMQGSAEAIGLAGNRAA